jgi:multiple sugar transport system substrate-binding protein
MTGTAKPPACSRRHFLRCALAGIGGLALFGALGACGPEQPADDQQSIATPAAVPPSSGHAQTTIAVWYWDDATRDLLKGFAQSRTDIALDLKNTADYDTHHQGLLKALADHRGAPDVAIVELGYLGAIADTGGLLDLSMPPFSGDALEADMVASLWSYVKRDGHLVALPWVVGPGAFWYRTDLLAAAGLPTDPATVQERIHTWDNFITLGQLLRQKSPTTALVANAAFDIFNTMVEQGGRGWIDGTKVLIAAKGTRPAQTAAAARAKQADGQITSNSAWDRALLNGTIAGAMLNSSGLAHLTSLHPQTAGKWRVVHSPERDFNLTGRYLAIPAQSQRQETAWTFVRSIVSTAEWQNAAFQATGALPAYMPAWRDPLYDQPVRFFGDQPVYRLWADIATKAPVGVISRYDRQADQIVGAELFKVLTQGKDPAQAMRDAEDAALQQIPGLTRA